MSLWNILHQHPGFERIRHLYNKQFPLEVRIVCAEWIEDRMKAETLVDIDDPQIGLKASQFLHELIQEVQNRKQKLNLAGQFPIKCRLDESIEIFNQQLHCPFTIYKHIRYTISCEQYLIGNVCGSRQINCTDQEAVDINNKLKELTNQVQVNEGNQTEYRHEVENYTLLDCSEKVLKKQFVLEVIAFNLYSSFVSTIKKIDAVQTMIIVNRLDKWKRDQALAGNGGTLNEDTLDEIQRWFETLGHVILNTRRCIEVTHELNGSLPVPMNMEEVKREITALLEKLIVSGFIVEKQPPQVMKRNVRFSATVRLLTTEFLKNNPSVVVSILSGKSMSLDVNESMCQAHHLKPSDESSGEILNNTGNLEMQPSTQHLSCNLGNMQLKNIKRGQKIGFESVTDQKFVLLFKSTFQMAGILFIIFQVWVKSLPIVVIVHTDQEPQSWATITWQNAFSEFNRVPSQMVDKVTWSQMAYALNMKFSCQTGRRLTVESLAFLREKALRATIYFNPTEQPISWSQFCKEPLPDRTFTFWDWFYAVMKLTRDYLRSPWIDGSLIGFISKRETERKLLQCPPGTFLLRFSDSQLDCIKDLHQCVTLYPGIPKDDAFGKYYSAAGETATTGYVKPILKVTVPDDTNRMLSNRNTPQHGRLTITSSQKRHGLGSKVTKGLTKSTKAWMN
ncbi:hypothetical protein HA402_006548 [Bradysia odoriphaga]|nr:hypothetical protein HA402_006548 [Bradysia odoriphaga]